MRPTNILSMAASRARTATRRAARGQQFRLWMPNLPMTLVSAKNPGGSQPALAIFRVPPRMTKHEIKEYLTKIYDLPVTKVNTMNYQGKRKRIITPIGKQVYYKYSDFKKAVVTFDHSLKDVGLGMRVLELEDEDDYDMDRGPPMDVDDDRATRDTPKQIPEK